MLMTVTEFLRVFAALARRADAGLVEGAARNAAAAAVERTARRLDDARTMRDLSRLGFAEEKGASAR